MIVRDYFSCQTCGHPHCLRIYVGANSFQKHAFNCCNCGEMIEVGMHVDYRTVSTEMVAISNCVASSFQKDASIITLHPEMVVPDDLQGKEYAFPFLFESHRIRTENPAFAEELERNAPSGHEAIEEWEKSGRLPPGPLHDWQFANRVWSLFLNGRYDVCADYIEREHANYRLDKPPEPKEVIYSFCARIGRGRAKEVFEVLAAECEVAWGKSPVQFAALRDYFVEKFVLGFLQGTHNIMAEYMKNYSEYSQVLIYQDRCVSLGEDARPSSTAFDDTKLFYGNAFEHLATYLVFPACLNNIIEGRAYDTFEKLTLKKYLALNKASKSGPFKANPKLSNISDVLNNQIRNASHHRRMHFDPVHATIFYFPNESDEAKFLPYGEYLMLCNSILQTIAGFTCFLIAVLRPEELWEVLKAG